MAKKPKVVYGKTIQDKTHQPPPATTVPPKTKMGGSR
jgi:hypothetical protein